MRALDTNLLVRLLVRDDPKQTLRADKFVTPWAWVSQLVLAETVWVLTAVYTLSRNQIKVAIEMLLLHETLVIERPDVVAAALAQFQILRKVGFTDCLVVEIARTAGHLPLGTFDRALSKTAGVVEPP